MNILVCKKLNKIALLSIFGIQIFANTQTNKENINVFGSLKLKDKQFDSISLVGKAEYTDIVAENINIVGPANMQNVIVDNLVVVGKIVGEKIEGNCLSVTGKADLVHCSFKDASFTGKSCISNSSFVDLSQVGIASIKDSILHNVTITARQLTLVNSTVTGKLFFLRPSLFEKDIVLILKNSVIEGPIEVEEGCNLSIIKKGILEEPCSVVSFDKKKEASFFSWITSFFK